MKSGREESQDDGLGRLVRRVLPRGPAPEELLEELLAERRRELDETAARFDASIADLERREELVRDSRASVDRMLRLGRKDLEAREKELMDFEQQLREREARVAEAEDEISRRRQELGAVELKRASVERREHDLVAREAQLDEREAELAVRPMRSVDAPTGTVTIGLTFVPGPAYALVEQALGELAPGAPVALDSGEYVVSRIGPSPLPGDQRRCAYLVAAARPGSGAPG